MYPMIAAMPIPNTINIRLELLDSSTIQTPYPSPVPAVLRIP